MISSLWRVDDQATADLMGVFYEKMWREGMAPAEALRAAQIDALQRQRARGAEHVKPAAWGAFVISGQL